MIREIVTPTNTNSSETGTGWICGKFRGSADKGG